MIKKFFVTLLAASAFLTSCSSDDDNKELSVEQRNELDDSAIEEYLENNYFHPRSGVITKFDDTEGNEDDEYPSLKSLAVKDPAGYYYAMRPGVEANGNQVESNDNSKILISYDAKYFEATNDLETYNHKYGSVYNFNSTINTGDGSANYDPSFYYYPVTQTQLDNGIKREYVELSYFVEGLKKFKATNTSGRDQYNFQGIIILPSRLAYGRNKMYTGDRVTTNHAYRNSSFIFTFELHKVTPRS